MYLPAIVVTLPSGETCRTKEPSSTMRLPLAAIEMLLRDPKVALVPNPSVDGPAIALPASVDTAPAVVILYRIWVLSSLSATNTLPFSSTATLTGRIKVGPERRVSVVAASSKSILLMQLLSLSAT
jgi:hypothetical protein